MLYQQNLNDYITFSNLILVNILAEIDINES